MPGDQDFVRPIHQTVKDFVMTQGLDQLTARAVPRSAIERSHDLQSEHHLALYRSCLNYLVTEVGQIQLERYESEELLEEFPLIEYSANNLFYHAEKAMVDQSTNLEDETKALQKMMDQWLSIHQKIYGNSWVYTRPGSTLLHEASAANLVKMVEGLISRGAQVSTKDDKGDTALHFAARGGHEGVAGVLSRAGADLRARNKYNETPLTYAAQRGQVRFIKWLLLEGVNLGEALPDEAAPSALMEAARWGHDQVVKLLLSSGAMTKVQRNRALLEAVRRQKYEVVKSLLKDGVEANPTTVEEYQSPLQAAIEHSSDRIVRILLQHGADPSRCDRYDRNALHLMAECGKFHLVERLKRVDLLINEKDCFGKTPLHGAIHYKHLDVAKLLFRRGADPHTLDGYGRSSLDWLRADPQNLPDIFKDICSSHAPTPQEVQASVLKQSVFDLSKRILSSKSSTNPVYFHGLGHCLMFLKDLDGALMSFRQQISPPDEDGSVHHEVACNFQHIDRIEGPRFICKSCPDVDLCIGCMDKYGHAEYFNVCEGHAFLEVSASIESTKHNQTGPLYSLSDNVQRWLEGLIVRYGDSCSDKTQMQQQN